MISTYGIYPQVCLDNFRANDMLESYTYSLIHIKVLTSTTLLVLELGYTAENDYMLFKSHISTLDDYGVAARLDVWM